MDSLSKFNRRDFLKLAGAGAAGLATIPLASRIEFEADKLVKANLLKFVTNNLIENEAIPDGVKDVPDHNLNFRFADDLLSSSIRIYNERSDKARLPRLYFQESPAFFDVHSWDFVSKSTSFLLFEKYPDLIKELFSKDDRNEGFWSRYVDVLKDGVLSMTDFTHDYARSMQKSGHYPITYLQFDMAYFGDIILSNPGAPLITRVREKLKLSDDILWSNRAMNNEAFQLLQNEIRPIWELVENFVHKEKRPMPLDLFISELIYLEDGDISGALWDSVVLTRLKFRHKKKNFEKHFFERTITDLVEKNDLMTDSKHSATLLEDSFAPRISANWVAGCGSDDLFAYNAFAFPNATNFKPFDLYCSLGNILHGLAIMASCSVTTPEVVQAMTVYEDYYKQTGILRPSYDYGLEKVVSDTFVAYRAPKIREILDRYK